MARVGGAGGPGGVSSGDAIGDANANAAEFRGALGDGSLTGGNDTRFFLDLQRAMFREQEAYTMLSTMMKAKHDMITQAIQKSG